MESITIGCITLTNVEHKPVKWDDGYPTEDRVENFPKFIVTGTVVIDGVPREFKRSVSLELDGRNADERPVEGFDWEADEHINTPLWKKIDSGQISEDLYNAIYSSDAYQAVATAFHGPIE